MVRLTGKPPCSLQFPLVSLSKSLQTPATFTGLICLRHTWHEPYADPIRKDDVEEFMARSLDCIFGVGCVGWLRFLG